MQLDKLLIYFKTSPAIKLLNAEHSPYIVDYLYLQFKRHNRITIPMSELRASLKDYLERLHETNVSELTDTAESYLSKWCTGETRYLHRFFEGGHNEAVYQLTRHTEEVFKFLDSVLQDEIGFIGTESRLRLIISTLSDLVSGSSDDPEKRIAHLFKDRQLIDEEIAKIQREGLAKKYEAAILRERFATAVSLLRQLLGDFRAVEDRFKQITHDVQQRQTEGKEPLGNILQFALDSEDLLKKDDQGVSFHEFFSFILSHKQQEKLQSIITELGQIEELSQQQESLMMVRRMVKSLLAEAEKVMRTNQRLTATLRRLLDLRAASERKQLAILLQDIKRMVSKLPYSSRDTIEICVDTGIEVNLPFARRFWTQPEKFDVIELSEHMVDASRRLEAFQLLAQMHRLDWKLMRDQVSRVVKQHGSATLKQVVEEFSLKSGIIELLGYVQLAHDDDHLISRDEVEEINVMSEISAKRYKVSVPLIYFMPKERSLHV